MAKFILRRNASLQYHFNLVANNGQIVLTGETYTNKQGALNGIQAVKINAPYDVRYQKLNSVRGYPYFTLRGANNEIIARGEEYSTSYDRDGAITWTKSNAPTAPIEDLTPSTIRSL